MRLIRMNSKGKLVDQKGRKVKLDELLENKIICNPNETVCSVQFLLNHIKSSQGKKELKKHFTYEEIKSMIKVLKALNEFYNTTKGDMK